MKAVVIPQFGGPEVLELQERPTPEPGVGQVRVRVHTAGLNRADIMQREGKYPAPADAPSDVPGLEIMGVVDALGPQSTNWKVGQRVFGLVGGGGYAEYVVTHERLLAPVPESLILWGSHTLRPTCKRYQHWGGWSKSEPWLVQHPKLISES